MLSIVSGILESTVFDILGIVYRILQCTVYGALGIVSGLPE